MATPPNLAIQARRSYVEGLIVGMPSVVEAVLEGAQQLVNQLSGPGTQQKRRDTVVDLRAGASDWLASMKRALRNTVGGSAMSLTRPAEMNSPQRGAAGMSLVDHDTIEGEILSSNLALAIIDRASWEFSDLRSRIAALEHREELDTNDVLRPHVLARIVTNAWIEASLSQELWRLLQPVLHEEFSHFAEEAYHEANRLLVQHRVLPEIDLRNFIRRARSTSDGTATGQAGAGQPGGVFGGRVGEETRLMTSRGSFESGSRSAEVLEKLNKLVASQLPGFNTTTPRAASPGLAAAIGEAQQGIQQRVGSGGPTAHGTASSPVLLEELQRRKLALKKAAATPVERATIEIVALLFQSILTEEAIPTSVRVWFARLQMPVLRVAIGEPDFFAAVDHPARRLIDRMGACVMGFDSQTRAVGDSLEREIKRVVQVVEAYPDTGRRVFQTVLTEFEQFLEHYFKNENEPSRKGISLAQQVEQRETLAIQYTIELRKMLNEVPVQEGVREFLFQVWADVLAMTAVKHGPQSDATKAMKRAAADLIWSANSKVSREERADVIRRLSPLLKTLNCGMDDAGVPADKKEACIQNLNNALAVAFTARAASISNERLEELMVRLETLEDLLPEAQDVDFDASLVLDLSGYESAELEVVGDGGSMPTPAMLAWAKELQVGGWYMLDYRDRNEPVQLTWRGLRKQLTLFTSQQGRGILFQHQRLAAFLQAGLLLPAQDEALTVRATRTALAKIDVDPQRLLS